MVVAATGLLALGTSDVSSQQGGRGAIVEEGFIYESAPFPSCHASTIVEITAGGAAEGDRGTLVSAFFGGKDEGDPSVGIWLSRRARAAAWSAPVEVADGVQRDGSRYPTWNPVLFEGPGGQLLLFYKVGPNPREWWGEWKVSRDGGRTWSEATRLDAGLLGPVRSKPLRLDAGTYLFGSSTEHDGWLLHFEQMEGRTAGDLTVTRLGAVSQVHESHGDVQAIQPSFLRHQDGRIQALCRTKQARVGSTWSSDGGHTWSALDLIDLPNPDAGVEALTLRDGRHLLVYNHKVRENGRWEGSRSRLNIAVSDDGLDWSAAVELENQPGEYSYPAAIQASDGHVHVTYTYQRRRIRHAVLDPEAFEPQPMGSSSAWPESKVRRSNEER